MRPMMRLLLAGVLFCVGLQVSGVKPVQAQDELTPGKYVGSIHILLEVTTKKSQQVAASSLKGGVYVKFSLDERINVEITSQESGLFTIIGQPYFTIEQDADAQTSMAGQTCYWGDRMVGKGPFSSPVLPSLNQGPSSNYNPAEKSFTLNLSWIGKTTWDKTESKSHGSIQGCPEKWGPGLLQAEMEAIEAMKKGITEITFTIDNFDSKSIEGTCELRKWEGKFTFPGVKTEREVTSCKWQVFLPEGKEWKKK